MSAFECTCIWAGQCTTAGDHAALREQVKATHLGLVGGVSPPCTVLSQDCNGNGVPDDCEVVNPFSGFALKLGGNNDGVAVPHAAALEFQVGQPITIGLWTRPDAVDGWSMSRSFGHPHG